jgi:hypothetical protein
MSESACPVECEAYSSGVANSILSPFYLFTQLHPFAQHPVLPRAPGNPPSELIEKIIEK